MSVAAQRGRIALCDLDSLRGTAGRGQKSRLRADGHADHVGAADFKVLVRKARVNLAHKRLPQRGRGVAARHDARRRVVADPDRCRVIRRVTDKVTVVVAVGRTGLTGDGHTGEVRARTRTAAHDVFQELVHRIGGALIHRDVGLGLIFKDDVAVMVKHLGIRSRRGVNAAAGKCCVGRGHLARRHALGKAAERERTRRGHIIVRQRREA